MAFIPAVNTAQVSMQFTQSDGEFAENTFYVEGTGDWSEAPMTTLAGDMITWWGTGNGTDSYKASQSSLVDLIAVVCRDLTTQTSPVVTVNPSGGPQPGTGSADPIQNGLTKAITARTGLSGRSFRGRTFLVGLTLDDLEAGANNQFAADAVGRYVSFMNALPGAISGSFPEAKFVVCSRYHKVGDVPDVPRDTAVLTEITSWGNHDLFVDFQRRRAPGHNRHH